MEAELSALKEVTRVQAKVLADFERMASLPIDQTWHERREEALKVLQAGEIGKHGMDVAWTEHRDQAAQELHGTQLQRPPAPSPWVRCRATRGYGGEAPHSVPFEEGEQVDVEPGPELEAGEGWGWGKVFRRKDALRQSRSNNQLGPETQGWVPLDHLVVHEVLVLLELVLDVHEVAMPFSFLQ